MKHLCISTLCCLLATSLQALAQSTPIDCQVAITSPAAGARVGPLENVQGTARVPVGHRVWVLAHRKGLALWWPQGGGAIHLDDGKWMVASYFGEQRDIGSEFELTARVFDEAGHKSLTEWVQTSTRTGVYQGIPMPPVAANCPAHTVVVLKTH